ncbi:hypothetical protein CORC01_09177 [Colletotrichum orchidophilum]|uniref:Uncharacterized protein n=1 Tax=Colletotrichum orchidophilum TaxID=1209926 RepID=A0A1G4B2H4_9PEZI|nr:uncharacterized protein CORC01_09177 [Colletotrichum orchidophilum]OHE95587.1 hypothetical protein CORC01_09177 [Colletotrichum orchidophilum]
MAFLAGTRPGPGPLAGLGTRLMPALPSQSIRCLSLAQ